MFGADAVTCSGSFNSSTANPGGLGGVTLTPNLDLVFDATANDTSAGTVTVGPGATAGALHVQGRRGRGAGC